MFRLLGPGLGGFLMLALWIYAVFDVISTDEILVRNLPKTVWLLLVIFVPFIGPIAWLILGRPLYAGWQPGGQTEARPQRWVAPEDRPGFATAAPPPGPSADDLRRWEDDLARREDELRRRQRDDEPPTLT